MNKLTALRVLGVPWGKSIGRSSSVVPEIVEEEVKQIFRAGDTPIKPFTALYYSCEEGTVKPLEVIIPEHRHAFIGISTEAIPANSPGKIQVGGLLVNPKWNFNINNGIFASIAPDSSIVNGFFEALPILIVGRVVCPNAIIIDFVSDKKFQIIYELENNPFDVDFIKKINFRFSGFRTVLEIIEVGQNQVLVPPDFSEYMEIEFKAELLRKSKDKEAFLKPRGKLYYTLDGSTPGKNSPFTMTQSIDTSPFKIALTKSQQEKFKYLVVVENNPATEDELITAKFYMYDDIPTFF